MNPATTEIVARAAAAVHIDATDSIPLRVGTHATFQLADGIVARIGRLVAERELRVSAWLTRFGIPLSKPRSWINRSSSTTDRSLGGASPPIIARHPDRTGDRPPPPPLTPDGGQIARSKSGGNTILPAADIPMPKGN
ncbi:hypothetical protein [Nocardia shimofusensis]|uniref:hypothetical protein n=1 Tax=Nocardia shimofusensis TaxID=228596 RepID=UPI000A5B9633|nr:hypothetical protein [Nocardia shimofusensis]